MNRANELFSLAVSFRSIDRPQSLDAARLLASTAVRAVEIWEEGLGSETDAVEGLKTIFSDSRIEVRTIHAQFGVDVDISSPDEAIRAQGMAAFERALDLAVRMEAKIVVVHPSAEPIDDDARDERLRLSKESIATMADKASKAVKSVAVEFLPRTCLGRSAAELKDLVDGNEAGSCGVCIDTNHLMGEYASLPDVVRELGNRVIALHCSDYDGVDEKHWPPMTGVIDWPGFVSALRDIGFPGPLNYEAKLDGENAAERVAFLERNYAKLCEICRAD